MIYFITWMLGFPLLIMFDMCLQKTVYKYTNEQILDSLNKTAVILFIIWIVVGFLIYRKI